MISSITATTSSTTGAEAMKKATGMNKDDFLKLFVTQLQNQDPLNPQDGAEFLGQLAQLTQVEQAYNTNSNLQNIIAAQTNAMSLSAVSFIGKNVLAEGSTTALGAADQPLLNYKMPQAVDQVTVHIADATGRSIRTLTGGAVPSGQSTIAWDGKDAFGNRAAAGTYSFSVTGTSNGRQVEGASLMFGKVDGVRVDGSNPVLTMSGMEIPLASVLQVQGG